MTRINFIEGRQYRVLKPGYSISFDYPAGPGARKFGRVILAVGDIIEYVGYRKGFDNYPREWFKKGDIQGDLEPTRYGWVEDPDILEEVIKKKGPLYPHVPKSKSQVEALGGTSLSNPQYYKGYKIVLKKTLYDAWYVATKVGGKYTAGADKLAANSIGEIREEIDSIEKSK